MSRRLLRHLDRHFGFRKQVETLTDSRLYPEVPLTAVWVTAFFLFVGRWRSLNAMEADLRKRPLPLTRLIGKRLPSADTVGRVLEHHLSAEELRQRHVRNMKRLERMKALHRRHGWRHRVGAVDCHEQFSTYHLACPHCLKRLVTIEGKPVPQYYHRFVFFELVGVQPRVMVDVEPVLPGEDEVAAADRLLARVFARYPQICQVVVADAAYQEAPFFRKLRAMGKRVIATLKDERRDAFVDAAGMLPNRKPAEVVEKEKHHRSELIERTVLRLWDFPELQTWPQLGREARVIHCQVETTKRHRRGTEWVMETETHIWWWITDLTVEEASTLQIMLMARWRWHLENTFNEMVHHWGLDHRFKHGPNALLNFLLTLFIAHLLTWAFYLRAIQPEVRAHLTCVGLGDQLRAELKDPKGDAGWEPP